MVGGKFVGNQNGYNAIQNAGNQNGNGNVVAARAEGTVNGDNSNQIRSYNYRGIGHYARNCIVKPRRMDQASSSGTQADKAPIYDLDGSAEEPFILEMIMLQQFWNRGVERRNQTLVEAARTMLIFSCASLFLWAEAIATACYTQNHSLIHRRFNKTPYELINGRKPDISFLHVFRLFVIQRIIMRILGGLVRRTKKIMETMNVIFDELSAMDFKQRSSKPELQGMTSGHISLGLALTYASSSITSQKLTELKESTLTPTNSSSLSLIIPNTLQDVEELPQQQHVQQQDNQAPLQPKAVADNVHNAMLIWKYIHKSICSTIY
nr:retrovirus-related Pol polyprotein from transposon TNT 1-94 [Tanacetum cinerariifolium]